MIRRAVIHQVGEFAPSQPPQSAGKPQRGVSQSRNAALRSGSQITSLIVMPGFVAPGIVAAFRGSR
jgi:hypothetical protein